MKDDPFYQAADELGLANDPAIQALARLLHAQDQERLNTIAVVNGMVPERRMRHDAEGQS